MLLKMPGVAMMSWVCGWCDWCSHACPEVCMHGLIMCVQIELSQLCGVASFCGYMQLGGLLASTDTTKLHEDAVAI